MTKNIIFLDGILEGQVLVIDANTKYFNAIHDATIKYKIDGYTASLVPNRDELRVHISIEDLVLKAAVSKRRPIWNINGREFIIGEFYINNNVNCMEVGGLGIVLNCKAMPLLGRLEIKTTLYDKETGERYTGKFVNRANERGHDLILKKE